MFEPALEPGLPDAQRDALAAAGIRAIHVRYDVFTLASQFTYYGDAAWGGPCLGCTGFDGDHDGYRTESPPTDCNDSDPSESIPPAEVQNLMFYASDLMAWDFPAGEEPLAYDVLRSTSRSNFVTGATCLESDDDTDIGAVDPAVPGSGGVFYYLVRVQTGCEGSLGLRSDGTVRAGRSCP